MARLHDEKLVLKLFSPIPFWIKYSPESWCNDGANCKRYKKMSTKRYINKITKQKEEGVQLKVKSHGVARSCSVPFMLGAAFADRSTDAYFMLF